MKNPAASCEECARYPIQIEEKKKASNAVKDKENILKESVYIRRGDGAPLLFPLGGKSEIVAILCGMLRI
jgi:hypothetical protein